MCIFLFWSTDVIFSTLMKNMEILKFKKKLKIKKILAAPVSFFAQILLIVFFSINDFFAQITFSCSLRGLLVQEVSKIQHQNSNQNWQTSKTNKKHTKVI